MSEKSLLRYTNVSVWFVGLLMSFIICPTWFSHTQLIKPDKLIKFSEKKGFFDIYVVYNINIINNLSSRINDRVWVELNNL